VKPMVEPRNVVLVGIRELDPKERRLVKESGVHIFTMRDIDERGMREVMSEALRFAETIRRASPSAWTWISSTRPMRPAWARRCAAASPTARRIWRWK
jgi:hypothetical protein